MRHTDRAYAKINLSLDIKYKMSDGYHYLKTVMQTVGLFDEITIECEPSETDEILVDTDVSYIPNDRRNIAAVAVDVFYKHTGITGYKTRIQIDKKIPVCAGMGGGSADAACVLRMLDTMFETELGLGSGALGKLAYEVGADVPFCVTGGTKLAEGRGEILSPLPPMPGCNIVICKPPFSCSTPELFSRVDCKKILTRPDTDGLVKALKNGDLQGVAKRMYNVFEDVLVKNRISEIDAIKGIMLDHGALGAVMTGSGSAVFGVFDDADEGASAVGVGGAAQACEHLAQTYKDCFLTKPVCILR